MAATRQRYNTTYDLANCDAEPLRFIRSCQDHASLIVLYADTLKIKAVSEDCAARYGRPIEDLVGADAGAVLTGDALTTISSIAPEDDLTTLNPIEFSYATETGYERENLILHRQGDYLILEIEPRDPGFGSTKFLTRLDTAMAKIQQSIQVGEAIFETTVREVKAITGYDRVWLYRFDEAYNGEIIAEAKIDGLASYLNLRYPHTDIPKQARDLYLRQQVRMVGSSRVNSDHLLVSDDDQPVDLSGAANRGVSPIHQEYLRAIGVGASLSIAITVNDKLWGLIACHHGQDWVMDYRLRQLLGFFGRIISGHLALHQSSGFQKAVLRGNLVRAKLVERMKESDDLAEPLRSGDPNLLDLVQASGAALIFDGKIDRLGACPSEAEINRLIAFVAPRPENLYATHSLHEALPEAKEFTTAPAGLLSIRITSDPTEYILLFRPEVITTVDWGGRPEHRKLIENGQVRLHPEMSFAKYTETKRGVAEEWQQHQLDNALALRNDIKEVILVKYQEMRHRQRELTSAYEEMESFSYTVSHDLRAPLRSIQGFAEILREDYTDRLDDWGQQALSMIVSNVNKMNDFINGILAFSRMGSQVLTVTDLDLAALIDEVWQDLSDRADVKLDLRLSTDTVVGDLLLFRQVFQNLLSNAIKYRRREVASTIEISSYRTEDAVIIEVADNGIGFDMKHAVEVFTVFNRLVGEAEYEGTGVGLAIVQRIVEKHRGEVTVVSKPGEGSTFTLRIPTDLRALLASGDTVTEA